MTDGWHVGREEIIEYCWKRFGVRTWVTIREWRINRGFPIRKMHNGKPLLIESEVDLYVLRHGASQRDDDDKPA